MNVLQLGYLIDACVSFPLAWAMLTNSNRLLSVIFDQPLSTNPCCRELLGALWMAIAVGAIAGLFFPLVCAPILMLQWVYKCLWLLLFAVPRWLSGHTAEVPNRIAGIFVAFVLLYPWILPWRELAGW